MRKQIAPDGRMDGKHAHWTWHGVKPSGRPPGADYVREAGSGMHCRHAIAGSAWSYYLLGR